MDIKFFKTLKQQKNKQKRYYGVRNQVQNFNFSSLNSNSSWFPILNFPPTSSIYSIFKKNLKASKMHGKESSILCNLGIIASAWLLDQYFIFFSFCFWFRSTFSVKKSKGKKGRNFLAFSCRTGMKFDYNCEICFEMR